MLLDRIRRQTEHFGRTTRRPRLETPMTDMSNEPGNEWLKAELEDGFDEDYELELGDEALSEKIGKVYKHAHAPSIEAR